MDQQNSFGQTPLIRKSSADVPSGINKGLKGILAGGIAGAFEMFITYPTEYVKTQLQLDEKGKRKQYDGIADCVKKTVRRQGFLGLYCGLSIVLYGSIPKIAVRFGFFEYFRSHMVDTKDQLSNHGKLLCGLGAGICEAIFIVTPMETIKVKFINDQRSGIPQYKGFFHGVSTIIKSEGFSGIYKGLTPTILKQGSNQAIRFFVVESLKDLYTGNDRSQPIPKPIVGLVGAIAGAASALGNTPVDVAKTRMQSLEAAKYKNTLDCFIKIWTYEGPIALFKGTVPRLCRSCLNVAITFMIYDSLMELLNKVDIVTV